MVLITVIVLFSINVTTIVIDSTRQASNILEGTKANYAAEAGLEYALFINHKLKEQGESVGANEEATLLVPGTNDNFTYTIDGTAERLTEPTVNLKYIIPFPWTGDAPWHGEGSIAGSGGCDPVKIPVPGTDSASKSFTYPTDEPNSPSYLVQEHPCNWGKLEFGQKVTIPLYGSDGTQTAKFDDITVRLRAPCMNGAEFCEANQRMDLNCWDKGTGAEMCLGGFKADKDPQRGEVVVLWQINAEKGDGTLVAMKPFENTYNGLYKIDDSQFYESKINGRQNAQPPHQFNVLSTGSTSPYPPDGALPQGTDLSTGESLPINSFISDPDHLKPNLTLSAVSSLVGCYLANDCQKTYDNPDELNYNGPHMIPYLEYQVVINNGTAATFAPVNKENLITVEGRSGQFTQTLQVKVPHDDTGLEYVIQQ